MASEKRGILYEAMLYRSLLSLRKKALISANIYWNQTPFNMKIDTDITIGSSADSPSHLFLISHSTAEHNSEMKFWRNMGEIREAKVRLPSNPFVIGVLFDAKVKKNLLKIQPYAFDQFLIIEWRDYGKNIIDFSSEFSERAPQEKNDKLRFLEENINSDSGLKTSLENLENDLLSSISQPSYSSSLWKAVREYTDKRGKGRIPASRETSLRRGLAKLLVFDEIPAKEAIIEDFYLDLRIGKKSLLGTRISDQDILNVLNLLNTLELTQLHYHYSSMKAFSILVKPLRTIAIFDKLWNELNSKWNLMTEGSTLFKFLKSSHENPIKTLDLQPSEASYVIPGWPVIFLITILKASFERRMAFGYSKIVNDIEKLSSSEKYAIIASSLGNHQNAKNTSSVRSSRTIEYGLRDWIFGEDRDNFNLQDCELALVAEVIARRIRKKVGFTLDSNLSRLVKEYFVSDTIETKLLSHPSFQPLKKILKSKLELHNISYKDIAYMESPMRAMAVADGEKINVRAGSTNVLVANSTLVRWISVSDAGKTHKCKEFCGKIWGLRIYLNQMNNLIEVNPEIKKAILLIDGTFNDEELNSLHEAGWDEIYYPDELEMLVESIKATC